MGHKARQDNGGIEHQVEDKRRGAQSSRGAGSERKTRHMGTEEGGDGHSRQTRKGARRQRDRREETRETAGRLVELTTDGTTRTYGYAELHVGALRCTQRARAGVFLLGLCELSRPARRQTQIFPATHVSTPFPANATHAASK